MLQKWRMQLMWTDMSPCDLHVFSVCKKILIGCRLKRWRLQCHSLAFVPATAEGTFFVGEIHWLVYQYDACFSAPWGLFLMASTPLHRKIPKCISFEQSWYVGLLGYIVLNNENSICHMACSFSQAHTGLLAIYVHISLLYELKHSQNQQTARG